MPTKNAPRANRTTLSSLFSVSCHACHTQRIRERGAIHNQQAATHAYVEQMPPLSRVQVHTLTAVPVQVPDQHGHVEGVTQYKHKHEEVNGQHRLPPWAVKQLHRDRNRGTHTAHSTLAQQAN